MSQLFGHLFSLVLCVYIASSVYVAGSLMLRLIKVEGQKYLHSGLAMMLGYGCLILFSLVLSFFGPLHVLAIHLFLLSFIVFGRRVLLQGYKKVWDAIKKVGSWQLFEKVLLTGIVFCMLFYLSAAFVPPYRTDALSYHIPEAVSIAEEGIGHILRGEKGAFYINLPAGMEMLYAVVYKINGFSLINVTHYSIVLAGLFLLYCFIKHHFDRRKALFASLFIFSIYEFFVNATNAYVDASMVVYEIAGFLMLFLWIKSQNRNLLILSGLLYGFALSFKYNALYGILLAGVLLVVVLLHQRITYKKMFLVIMSFGVPLLLVSGFWYIKNLILFHNPVYPFYFGHVGYGEAEYIASLNSIRSFTMERNVINFIFLPFKFFLDSYRILTFLAFISWPLVFLWRKLRDRRKLFLYFSYYIAAYSFIWFFLATHQHKFFFVPTILLFIMFGIQADMFLKKVLTYVHYKIILVVLIPCVALFAFKVIGAKDSYFVSVKKADIYYNLGIDDKEEFYKKRNMGSIYAFSQYVNEHYQDTNFFDVWGATRFFLDNNNRFVPSDDYILNTSEFTSRTLIGYLKEKDFQYAIVDSDDREQTYGDPGLNTLSTGHNIENMDKVHVLVEEIGEKIYELDRIELYKFDLREES